MNKVKSIQAHLVEHGSITPKEAYELYHSMRLAAVIFYLRDSGLNITTTMEKSNDGSRYARYTLEGI